MSNSPRQWLFEAPITTAPARLENLSDSNWELQEMAVGAVSSTASEAEWEAIVRAKMQPPRLQQNRSGKVPIVCRGIGQPEVLDRFGFNQAALSAQHQQQIQRLAGCIVASQTTARPVRSLRLVGHTDPVGTDAYNLQLGQRRAEQVRNRLQQTLEAMQPGLSQRIAFVIESRGEREPVSNDPAQNRRVQIWLYPANPLDPGSPNFIQQVQGCLNRLMGSRLALDGKVGRQTSSAIRSFQQQQSLPVSGLLNPVTIAALIRLCGQVPVPVLPAATPTSWLPLHADEGDATGRDRFTGQTFDCGKFSIFVPKGAKSTANKVHVFFSPGSVTGSSGFNAVLTHGLRSAFDASDWILISVPGVTGGFNTISTAEIAGCLVGAGRSAKIDALRLSAHSRGCSGLMETVAKGLINTSIVDRVFILDSGDIVGKRGAGTFPKSGIPGSKIVAYGVNTANVQLKGAQNLRLPPLCVRAVGYSRLIQDAMVTRPTLTIPPAIRSQLLPLPPRGCLTTSTSVSGCQVNFTSFCKSNAKAVTTIINQENNPKAGLKRFVDDNDLIRFGMVFSAGIYSHHLFVSEIAHEMVK